MSCLLISDIAFAGNAYRVAKTHRMPYKLQVIFCKRATNHTALLRKITYLQR